MVNGETYLTPSGSGDAAAINSALAAINTAGGGTLHLQGTYLIDSRLTAFSNTVLRGEPGTVLKATAPLTAMFTMASRSAVRFEHLTFDGGGSAVTTVLSFIGCNDVAVRDCTFQNATNSGASGVRLNGGTGARIRDCTFSTMRRGIYGTNNGTSWLKRARVRDCYFTGMDDAGIYVNGTDGVAASEDFRIDGCTMENFTGVGARSGIYFVVGPGSTTKHKRVRIRDCTLTGRFEAWTAGTGNSDFLNYYDCVDGTVSGCEVQGGGDIGISLSRSDRNAIVGNSAHDNHTFGISCWDSSFNTITGNQAFNNRRNFGGALLGNKAGILCRSDVAISSNNAITGNVCFDNQPTKTQQYGVSIEAGCANNIVAGNVLRGNLTAPILDAGATTMTGTNAV